MGALQYIATSALSLTLSGNTGVGPFLTLFIVGVIEKSDPTLLHMEGWVETIVASWPSVVIFGCLAILEFVGHCVPVVDAVIDSAMVFVVPILSVLGSLSSFGLFTAPPPSGSSDAAIPDIMQSDYEVVASSEEGKSGFLIFLQVMLCLFGICLALLVHLFRLLLRLMGEGCCTCCITFVEISWIAISVTICIFIVPIAIGAAILLMVAGAYGFKHWWEKRRKKKEEEGEAAATAGTGGEGPGDHQASSDADTEAGARPNSEENAKTAIGEGTSKNGLQEPLLP